jgi:hypothetical protein
MRSRIALAGAGLLMIVSCAGNDGRVTGIVTGVQGDLGGVVEFEVRPPGRDPIVFVPEDGLDVFGDGATPISHLFEHMTTGEPVRVTYTSGDGGNIAILVEDA